MKIVIVGLGIQGEKRKKNSDKSDLIATVDPKNKNADYKNLEEVPIEKYDTVFICTPNKVKKKIIEFCLKEKKNFLVEKPLINKNIDLNRLSEKCRHSKVVGYTAYNHRFEPHFINIKNLLKKKKIGKIYYCKIFYGNGTAKLVKKSSWKDIGDGVISDLGSHLLDMVNFWFNCKYKKFKIVKFKKFENNSPDYMNLIYESNSFFIELEATLCMWKNTFRCEIIGSKGSLSVESLCKWGPSTLIYRKRKYPSGAPKETARTLRMNDPTWRYEYLHFKKLIRKKSYDNFKSDKIIKKIITLL
jgi:scyllo-inositol 2-dehydrogenase (NADP+)